MRDAKRSLLLVVAAFAIASCAHAPSTSTAESTEAPTKLAAVSPLPAPSLPPWIASISPTKSAQNLAQIRVIFRKPIAPLSALEGDNATGVLSRFSIEPALRGRFVLLTPKMVGFVADEALPAATRVRVTVAAGLADLDGDKLQNDLAWTFQTEALQLSDLPTASPSPPPVSLRPVITITANTPVDISSLASHAKLEASGVSVALQAKLEATPTPYPGMPPDAAARFGATAPSLIYDLTPDGDLRPSTTYTLKIAPGVEPVRGNVATMASYHGSIRTYDPLTIEATPTPNPNDVPASRFASGDPVISFNNPIDKKTIDGNVTISPLPSPSPRIILQDDGSTIAVDPYALAPNTHYTLTVGNGLKDTFGQSLAQAATVDVNTGDFAPGLWAPTGWNQLPGDANIDINFYATNLPGNIYRSQFHPLSAIDVLKQSDPEKVLGDWKSWPQRTLAQAKKNEQSVVRIDAQQQLHAPYGALAYGFGSKIGTGVSATGVVQLTNLGVFAQFFPGEAHMLVQHLDDGSPAANVDVAVYRSPNDSPQQCAHAMTGPDGVARMSVDALQSCYVTTSEGQMPMLGVIASEGPDVAAVTVYDWSGVPYPIRSGWASGAPAGTGTIFPDRDMYQPGERGQFTGVAYYVQDGEVRADRDADLSLSLHDPNGNDTPLGKVHTDAYGTFSYPHTFGAAQPLGYYQLIATAQRGYKLYGDFRVAEFTPPNFKLDVQLSGKSAAPGQSIEATGTAAYLFGAPLSGGKNHVYVTREYASLSPKGWDEYWFGRQWFWPQRQPSITTDVLQQDLAFDANGVAKLSVPVANDLPAPLRYNVEMEATDVSNLSVSDSQSFLALPNSGVIGLAADVVGPAKSALPVKVIVTDQDGKTIGGRAIHLELQRMTYLSASESEEGGTTADDSVKFETVDRADVTSGDSPVTAKLTPPDAGSYRVRANFSDAGGDASASDLQVFAYGSEAADFGAEDRSSVKVTLDKKTYKVGDTATAVVASPFDVADVYVSVVRYGTIYSTTLHSVHGSPRVSFAITPRMFPNAAIEAVVVRRGQKLSSVKPGSLDSLARSGMAGFGIDVKDRYLKVAITPQQAKLQPGAQQRVAFHVTDANAKPVHGKVIAMAVNDAILQLSGYRLPDLVDTIFAQQAISTRYADSRANITLQTPKAPVEKGFGYGGGFLAGAAGTRVRKNFQPLAYYGTLITDASGNGSASFTIPDNLTTWRVMAIAIAEDDQHFGTSDATFIAQLPLMANPLLPQFARPGDRVDMGISVLAPDSHADALDLALQLTGGLQFASGDPMHATQHTAAPSGIQAYRFPVNVGSPAPSTFGARAQIGALSDAFSLPFSILDRATTESVVQGGTTNGDVSIPVDRTHSGTYTISLANSITPQLQPQGEAVLKEDSIGTANDLASRLLIAAAVGDRDAAMKNAGELLKLQRDDGGFAYSSFAKKSDAFATSYALQALAFAKTHGASVDARALSRAMSYADATLANPERSGYCKNALCHAQTRFAMLEALAATGDRRTSYLDEVFAQRDKLENATQLRLARYLLAAPGYQQNGEQYAQQLKQNLYLTGRYANVNLSTPWGWLDDVVTAQAEMLQLLLATHAPGDQLDGAARALLAQSCKCGWQTPQATASAILALQAYGAQAPPRSMNVSVKSGSASLGAADFGASTASKTLTVASSQVNGDALSLHASAGTLHYIVTFTYDVPSNSPGNVTAFHVTRELFDPGSAKPMATIDLTSPSALGMKTGRVFDIGVRIAVDHPVDRVVIEDPLPAGFEAVDGSFATSTQSVLPQSDNWEINERKVYRDRVVGFAAHLEAGVYEMHYLVRSVTPGDYRWPGSHVYLEDAPEQFGRTASAELQLK